MPIEEDDFYANLERHKREREQLRRKFGDDWMGDMTRLMFKAAHPDYPLEDEDAA